MYVISDTTLYVSIKFGFLTHDVKQINVRFLSKLSQKKDLSKISLVFYFESSTTKEQKFFTIKPLDSFVFDAY